MCDSTANFLYSSENFIHSIVPLDLDLPISFLYINIHSDVALSDCFIATVQITCFSLPSAFQVLFVMLKLFGLCTFDIVYSVPGLVNGC